MDYLIEAGKQCSWIRLMIKKILDDSLTGRIRKRKNGGRIVREIELVMKNRGGKWREIR